MPQLNRRTLFGVGAGALAATAVAGGVPAHAKQSVTGWVRSTLDHMSLEQKVGQLMVQEVYGADADTPDNRNLPKYGTAKPVDVVKKFHLGGVIYFAWTDSFKNGPTGVAKLSNGLQAAALDSGNKKIKIPLIVATDQEQGIVTRFLSPATQFPGNMALGATRSAADARQAAAITGQELRAVGINTNFAPDADVNINPANPVIGVRSFSSDPALVSELVTAQVHGYQSDGKVSSSPKHFPGHGDTATDSHYGLPVITHTREEWEKLDAPPFKAAIAADADLIMTAHLMVPALDPSGDPATLSKPILTGVLREQLGFKGVVITDSLEMQGVRDKYGDAEVAVRAMEAGVDIILMSPTPLAARDAIIDAVRTGRLTEAQINAKVERVMRMKWKRGIVDAPLCDVASVNSVVGIPSHLAVADRVTDRAITLVRNTGVLPMPVAGKKVLVAGWGVTSTQLLADELTKAGAIVTRRETGTNPTAATATAVETLAKAADVVLLSTYNVASYAGQRAMINKVIATGKPVIAAALRNPYDVGYYEAPAELCTYSYSTPFAASLVRIITGQVNPSGKLPVDVPNPAGGVAYPFGHGLTY